jgi:Flp pilus assembly protein TadD
MSAVGQRTTRPGEALCNEHIGRFVRLIEENPKEAIAEYGLTFLNSIDESDAAWFKRGVGLADESWRQRFLETVAIHRRGRLDEAEKAYKELLAESKKSKEIEYNLAALQLQRGDLEAARKHLAAFEKHLESIDPATVAEPLLEEHRVRLAELKAELDED